MEQESTASRIVQGLREAPARTPRFWIAFVVTLSAICLVVYVTVAAVTIAPQPRLLLTTFLAFAFVAGFLMYPLGRARWDAPLNAWFAVDILLILLSLAVALYIVRDPLAFALRGSSASQADLTMGTIMLVLTLELARRTLGWSLLVVPLFAIVYTLFANYAPEPFTARPQSYASLVTVVFMRDSTSMHSNIATTVIVQYVFLFVVFAGLLVKTGAGQFFLEVARALAGGSTGGMAKVSVIGSGLVGSISGASTANVLTTGSVTIPAMKSRGYPPNYAGAVEAIASTGGQILPPVMGASAFVMADFLGVPYWEVVKAAFLPAVLFYVSVFMFVHFDSIRLGLRGEPRESLPRISTVLAGGWHFLLPFAMLVYLLFRRFSPDMAVAIALALLFAVSLFRRGSRLAPRRLVEVFVDSLHAVVPLVAAGAVIGVILGALDISGLGLRFASLLMGLAGSDVFFLLLLAAVASLILGMGMPTVAAYVTVAALLVPTLLRLGLVPMGGHLFAMYFGVISLVTPPVAVAAYVAAGVAGGSLFRTGFQAFRLGAVAYVIPFVFVYRPELLFIGPPDKIVTTFVEALIGITLLAGGLLGHLLRPSTLLERALLLVAGVAFLMPGLSWNLSGMALAAIALLMQHFLSYSNPFVPVLRQRAPAGQIAPPSVATEGAQDAS